MRHEATIELHPNSNFEQALEDLIEFSHIWVVAVFDRVGTWKPKVLPPRSLAKKGLFATRSPHRPNPISITVCRLLRIDGLLLTLEDTDLLDGTPILDIKPYIAEHDSIPAASSGWLEEIIERKFDLIFSATIQQQLGLLPEQERAGLLARMHQVLEVHPFPHPYKRVKQLRNDLFEFAYKNLRVEFKVTGDQVTLLTLMSLDL